MEYEFRITDDFTADWAVRTIKEAQAERDRLLELADTQLAELQAKRQQIIDKCDNDTAFLTGELMAYMETVKTKQTKTQDSYQLLSGKLVKKKAKLDFTHDDAALLEYALEKAPQYVKTKQSFDWAAYKKGLQIVDGSIVNEDGEIVEIAGLGVEEKPASFSVV